MLGVIIPRVERGKPLIFVFAPRALAAGDEARREEIRSQLFGQTGQCYAMSEPAELPSGLKFVLAMPQPVPSTSVA